MDNSTVALRVSELFVSIQGESTYAGMPCGFIRLGGCNLQCAWCDTGYALDDGEMMSLESILNAVDQWSVPLIEITGGEPLLQSGCHALAEALAAMNRTVLIETNGSRPIQGLPEAVIRILDIKCPGSGMSSHMHWENIKALTPRDEVKFVLGGRADYEWALDIMKGHGLADRCGAVLFSPVSSLLEARTLAAWMVEDLPPARLQLQLHKYIWPPDMRGV